MKTFLLVIVIAASLAASVSAQDFAVTSQQNTFNATQRFAHGIVVDCRELGGEPLSRSGRAKVICDSGTLTLKVSINGGTFGDIGGATWGRVTGTLSAQIDLRNALNGKVSKGSNATLGTISQQTGSGIATDSVGIGDAEGDVCVNGSFFRRGNGGGGKTLYVCDGTFHPVLYDVGGTVTRSSGVLDIIGAGAPSGACITASTYRRTDGTAGATLYICEATTWAAK